MAPSFVARNPGFPAAWAMRTIVHRFPDGLWHWQVVHGQNLLARGTAGDEGAAREAAGAAMLMIEARRLSQLPAPP